MNIRERIQDWIAAWDESTLKVRLKICWAALTIDPNDSSFAFNRLHGMLEWRHFQFTAEQCKMEGKADYCNQLYIFLRERRGNAVFSTVEEVREFLLKERKHTENLIKLHRQSYLNHDNKYFYWSED